MQKDIKHLIKMSDDGDPWGNAMQFRFGIAELVYRYGDVPEHWEFEPGLSANETPEEDSFPDSELEYLYQNGYCTLDDMIKTGNILKRYTDHLDNKGLSY